MNINIPLLKLTLFSFLFYLSFKKVSCNEKKKFIEVYRGIKINI